MAKKVTATAKENNVKENVAMETVENTVNAENVKENVEMENTATVETVETVETPATAPVEETPAPVETVEETRANILHYLEIANTRKQALNDVNAMGEKINATNWGKDDTRTGNGTLGGFVREELKKVNNTINELKLKLKGTYYNISNAVKILLENENATVKVLGQDTVDRMSNAVLFRMAIYNPQQWQVEHYVKEYLTADIVKALYVAEIEEIGVSAELLGYAMPVFSANGYVMDISKPQPVTVEDINIDGLDKVKGYTYYSFKRA